MHSRNGKYSYCVSPSPGAAILGNGNQHRHEVREPTVCFNGHLRAEETNPVPLDLTSNDPSFLRRHVVRIFQQVRATCSGLF